MKNKELAFAFLTVLTLSACSGDDSPPTGPHDPVDMTTLDMDVVDDADEGVDEFTVVTGARWVPESAPATTSDDTVVRIEENSILVAESAGEATISFGDSTASDVVVTVEPNPWRSLGVVSQTLCVESADGEVYCSGDLGPEGLKSTPVRVTDSDAITGMAVADALVCGIIDGAVHCRGDRRLSPQAIVDGPRFSTEFERIESADGQPAAEVDVMMGDGMHACLLTDQGDVQCWGVNHFAPEAPLNLREPRSVGLPTPMSGISVNAHSACAFADSTVTCWGINRSMALGSDEVGVLEEPAVRTLEAPIVDLSLGPTHVCAITEDDRLFCAGEEANWSTAMTSSRDFVEVDLGDERPLSVSAASNRTCVRTHTGRALCAGVTQNGLLPEPPESTVIDFEPIDGFWLDMIVEGNGLCGISYQGEVQCRGIDKDGHFGTGRNVHSPIPQRLEPNVGEVTSVALGDAFMCFGGSEGVECRGVPYLTQTNPRVGSVTQSEPFKVLDTPIISMLAALRLTVVRNDQGLTVWGLAFGGIGNGSIAALEPTEIVSRPDIGDFAGGELNSCYVASGNVYCWGRTLGDSNSSEFPTLVQFADDPEFEFQSIALGKRTVRACGIDLQGRLGCFGDAKTSGRWELQIDERATFEGIVGLPGGYCAWTDDGTLYCTGAFYYGADLRIQWLGGFDPFDSPTVRAAAFGEEFGCILDDAGAIHCIGDGSRGQLGPDHKLSSTFVPTGFEGTFVDIWAGADRACALDDAGQLWCWGAIDQAGEASRTNAVQNDFEPVQLPQP